MPAKITPDRIEELAGDAGLILPRAYPRKKASDGSIVYVLKHGPREKREEHEFARSTTEAECQAFLTAN